MPTKTFGLNIYGLLSLVTQIAFDIRRIKEFDKYWKWIFINLVPIIANNSVGNMVALGDFWQVKEKQRQLYLKIKLFN